jgi:dipeptidyl-peptidase-4
MNPAPLFGLLGSLLLVGNVLADASPLTLERLTSDPPLAGRLPRQAEISPGGRWISYLRPSATDSEVLELWAQPTAGGAPRKLVAAADLLGGQEQRLSEAEKMALERRRIGQRGIVEYRWCGEADDSLLFPLSGAIYRVRLGTDGPQTQKLPQPEGAAPAQDLVCDAAGRQLGFARDGQLWVQPLDGTAAARALTRDGGGTVSWGLAEFIAAEELGRQRGFWWAPDGRRLLALRVDEAPVGVKARARIAAQGTTLFEQRYPAAGEPNAKVSAWVLDAANGEARELPLPAGTEYIARAGWFKDGTPWLQTFNRPQTELRLTEFRPEAHTITVETDPAWVEVHDDLAETREGLLWPSEASGTKQLLLVDRRSGARRALTTEPEPIAHRICQREDGIVYAVARDRGRSQALRFVDWRGHSRDIAGEAPRQWREARADVGCQELLVTRSAWNQPPRLERQAVAGGKATVLEGDAPDPLLAQLAAPQDLELTAADGKTALNAFWFPPQAGSGKRPVIVQAYGGPGSATVSSGWLRDRPMIAYWQQRGYGVLMLDTRGMAHRDRAFTRAHHHAFGQVEVADLFAAVRQLPKLREEVDPARIGFFGWSYGGFLASRAVLDADTPFAASIGVAPVTDWTLYDTAYTERYLGLPSSPDSGGKAAPYAQADLPSRASLLARPLLLVHGTADDNVLFDHSLRLVEALETQGKVFDLAIYPGKAHGIAGRAARLHLYRSMEAFFERNLKPARP